MTKPTEAAVDLLAAHVGSTIGPTQWFLVDQTRVDAFGTAIDAQDPIHCDPVNAAASRFGGTIAQGFYIAGLMPKLLRQAFGLDGAGPGMAYGVEKLRFPSVVRSGKRVRLAGTLEKVEPAGHAAIASFNLAVEIEGEERLACVATLLVRYTGARTDA